MTNLAQSPLYTDALTDNPAPSTLLKPAVRPHKSGKVKTKKAQFLSEEDSRIVMMIENTKKDLDYLHNCYDQTTDPLLVDSIIYEIKATQMKYVYYLNLCKEKGIISGL